MVKGRSYNEELTRIFSLKISRNGKVFVEFLHGKPKKGEYEIEVDNEIKRDSKSRRKGLYYRRSHQSGEHYWINEEMGRVHENLGVRLEGLAKRIAKQITD
jgi:hypothetical protein